jgi:hypothetical protein
MRFGAVQRSGFAMSALKARLRSRGWRQRLAVVDLGTLNHEGPRRRRRKVRVVSGVGQRHPAVSKCSGNRVFDFLMQP